MGEDSVTPFLGYPDKWVIVLGLTSNKGSADFQRLECDGKPLYQHVLEKVSTWGNPGNMMFVTGATHASDFVGVRKILPLHFFLVPGVGAQGGDLNTILDSGQNQDSGLLINVSRDILYASNSKNFAEAARNKALAYLSAMESKIPV